MYDVFASPMPLPKLKDLLNFGDPLTEHEANFRWPTRDKLKKLNLNGPLKLEEIRTKGVNGNFMTAIQLVFEGGIESPMFDTNHPNASNEISTVQIPDAPISRVSARIFNTRAQANIRFEQGEGSTTVFNKNYKIGRDETREIPANHHIVGVYGRAVQEEFLLYLGFIIAEF